MKKFSEWVMALLFSGTLNFFIAAPPLRTGSR